MTLNCAPHTPFIYESAAPYFNNFAVLPYEHAAPFSPRNYTAYSKLHTKREPLMAQTMLTFLHMKFLKMQCNTITSQICIRIGSQRVPYPSALSVDAHRIKFCPPSSVVWTQHTHLRPSQLLTLHSFLLSLLLIGCSDNSLTLPLLHTDTKLRKQESSSFSRRNLFTRNNVYLFSPEEG